MSPHLPRHASHPLTLLLALFVCLTGSGSVAAAEADYLTTERPVTGSVKDAREPMSEVFIEEPPPIGLFPRLRGKLKSLPAFIREGTLKANLRNYHFGRANDNSLDNEAWALGGSLSYTSGWWRDRIRISAALYTSQKLHGLKEKDGTLLLKSGQESFTVPGEANIEVRVSEQSQVKLFRQFFKLPYINRQDNRMVPNTFEAYTFLSKSVPKLSYLASHITKMKRRNASKFVSMSEAAGFDDTNEPLTMVGARYSFTDDINIGAITEYSWNFMNTVYAEANATWKPSEDLALRLSGQYSNQKSVGDALGGNFKTDVYGAKLATSYRGATLNLAYTSTGANSGIRSPYGGYPGYLSLMVKDFNRADENAWLIGLSYDFSALGLKGLSTFVNYARGNTPESSVTASADQDELDLTIDYRPPHGPLKGLWLRVRGGFVDQEGRDARDVDDVRVILNYEIPIL